MLDINATIGWLKGGLVTPNETWGRYAAKNPGWQYTAINIALPLLIIAWLGVLVMSALFLRGFFGGAFLAVLRNILFAGVVLAAGGFVVSFLAGKFGGRDSFDQGFAAVSFAMIPGQLGSIFDPIPYLGWIIATALSLYGAVLLYQNTPVFLKVPEDKRVVHFVLTLVSMVIVALILGAIFFGGVSAPWRRF